MQKEIKYHNISLTNSKMSVDTRIPSRACKVLVFPMKERKLFLTKEI